MSPDLTERLRHRAEVHGTKGFVFGVTYFATKAGQPRDRNNVSRALRRVFATQVSSGQALTPSGAPSRHGWTSTGARLLKSPTSWDTRTPMSRLATWAGRRSRQERLPSWCCRL